MKLKAIFPIANYRELEEERLNPFSNHTIIIIDKYFKAFKVVGILGWFIVLGTNRVNMASVSTFWQKK